MGDVEGAAASASECPLCGGANDCALAGGSGSVEACWCVSEHFPRSLLDAVSEKDSQRCICRTCLTRAGKGA